MAWETFVAGRWGHLRKRFLGFCSHTGRVTPPHEAARKNIIAFGAGRNLGGNLLPEAPVTGGRGRLGKPWAQACLRARPSRWRLARYC